MRSSLTSTLIAVGLSISSATSALAEQELVYSVKKTVTNYGKSIQQLQAEKSPSGPAEEPPPQPKTTIGDQRIVLGKNFILIDENGQRTIIDFDKKQMQIADLGKKTYTQVDLHAAVYFRIQELQNRMALARRLAAAGITDNPLNPFDSETALSITLPDATEIIETSEHDATKEYSYAGKIVASYKPSAVALDEASKAGYRRFLANACQIHPSVRAALLSEKFVPQQLNLHVKDSARDVSTEYSLKNSAKVSGETGRLPAEFTLVKDQELAPIYEAIAKHGGNLALPSADSVTQAANKLVDSANILDAMLTVLEYTLSSGDPMTAQLSKLAPLINKDKEAQLFAANLTPQRESQAKESLKLLDSIDRSHLSKGDVIDIMRANIYTTMQQPSQTIKLLTDVLAKNPLIAGAYHDLGDAYCATYRMGTAWECYRLGRKIAPTHPLFKEVSQLEASLEKDFPAFF